MASEPKKTRKSSFEDAEDYEFTANPLNTAIGEVTRINESPNLRKENSYTFERIESVPDPFPPNEGTIEEQ